MERVWDNDTSKKKITNVPMKNSLPTIHFSGARLIVFRKIKAKLEIFHFQ